MGKEITRITGQIFGQMTGSIATRIAVSAALALASVAPITPRAQADSGIVEGRIVNGQGMEQAGIEISVSGKSMPVARSTRSGPDGRFRFIAVPPGNVTLHFHDPAGIHQDQTRVVGVHVGRISDVGRYDFPYISCPTCCMVEIPPPVSSLPKDDRAPVQVLWAGGDNAIIRPQHGPKP